MSIIYDALQKVEKRSSPRSPQNKFTFKMSLLALMILAGALYLYFLGGKSLPAGRQAQAPNQVKAAKKVTPQAVKPAAKKPPSKRSFLVTNKEAFKEESFKLSGIIYSKSRPSLAIINNQKVSQGEVIEKATVSRIKEDSVILNIDGKNMILNLK